MKFHELEKNPTQSLKNTKQNLRLFFKEGKTPGKKITKNPN